MIEPYTGIERNPRGEILAEVDISGHFIYGLVGKLRALVAAHGLVPSLAAEMLKVHTQRNPVAGEERCRLIERQPAHLVVMDVIGRAWRSARMVSVVDVVVPPIVEHAQGSRRLAVIVGERQGSHSAGYLHVVVDVRIGCLTWIGVFEIGYIYMATQCPCGREVVADFHESGCLFEF